MAALGGIMVGIKPTGDGVDHHVKESSDLYRSAEENNLAEVQAAVTAGADVNTSNLQGVTPLLLAVKNGNQNMVQFLLKSNADVNMISSDSSPIHEAIRQHSAPILEILLSNKAANVNLPSDGGKTPVHFAILEKQTELLDLLLRKGADAKCKSITGSGCLHFAVVEGDRAMIERFVPISGGINEQNNNGKTPLHVAAEKGNIDAVKVLLNNNANTTIKDGWGRLASECGKITAFKMISEHKPGMKYEFVTADDDDEGVEKKPPSKAAPPVPVKGGKDDKKKKKVICVCRFIAYNKCFSFVFFFMCKQV